MVVTSCYHRTWSFFILIDGIILILISIRIDEFSIKHPLKTLYLSIIYLLLPSSQINFHIFPFNLYTSKKKLFFTHNIHIFFTQNVIISLTLNLTNSFILPIKIYKIIIRRSIHHTFFKSVSKLMWKHQRKYQKCKIVVFV